MAVGYVVPLAPPWANSSDSRHRLEALLTRNQHVLLPQASKHVTVGPPAGGSSLLEAGSAVKEATILSVNFTLCAAFPYNP